jgi:hypothetical protein
MPEGGRKVLEPTRAELCPPLPRMDRCPPVCTTMTTTPDCAALHSSAAAAAAIYPVPMAVSHDCSLTLAPCSPACCCR